VFMAKGRVEEAVPETGEPVGDQGQLTMT
jgi:hypothetical protein